jgi:hypothetical protein
VWDTSGVEAAFQNWRTDEPNGKTRENCVHVEVAVAGRNRTWNDESCDTGLILALCQTSRLLFSKNITTLFITW